VRAPTGRLRAAAAGARSRWRRSRWLRVLLITFGSLIVLAVILDVALDRPIRGIVERRMNDNLVGYTAKVGHANFHLYGLALVLEDTVVSQDAQPDPPVIAVPRLRMSVHWVDLLALRLVADAVFVNPVIHANLAQLQEENQDEVPVTQRGWQRALESIYPLKINELEVRNGKVVYEDQSDFRPLELSGVDAIAKNIRNVRSRDRTYPSTLHAEAWVFDSGRAVIDGRADFLAEPTPGVTGRLDLQLVELTYFEPLLKQFGLKVKQGFVSGGGSVEWAPGIQVIDLESVDVVAAAVEYESGAGPTPQARRAGQRISEVAKSSFNNPEVHYLVRHLGVEDATLDVVNRVQDPPYRLKFSKADLALTNFSSRAEDGPAQATLDATFMGSGAMKGDATFYPEGEHANFAGKVAIHHTPLASLNDVLRARGNFDVAQGTFELYTEFQVRDGAIDGYVKPMFRNIEVLDSAQDKHKNVFRKMYEGVIGGAAKILENHKGEVATVTSLKGPAADPKADTWQALGGLLKNAFVKAILPGFRREIHRVEPVKYRAAMKREKKDTEARRGR